MTRLILGPVLALALAACGASDPCVTYCTTASTCSGKTGWKTTSCTQTCANYQAINALADCTALYNQWLDCEAHYDTTAGICQNDTCEGEKPYADWQACVTGYCDAASPAPAACAF